MESEEERNHVHIVHMCIILDVSVVDVTHKITHSTHTYTVHINLKTKPNLIQCNIQSIPIVCI